MAEQSERSSQGLPASLKAYQHDLERAAILHPLSAACLQLWDMLLCEVVDETVSAYAQAHAAGPSPLPPAAQELLEGWTSEQTSTAAASSAVRDVLELEASAVRARNPSQAATAQLEDIFGNRPKQTADTIVCTNCGTQVSSNRRAPMSKAAALRYPEASANSPSSFDTARQRQMMLRAASSLGQPRPASLGQPRPASASLGRLRPTSADVFRLAGQPNRLPCTGLAFDPGTRRTWSDVCWVRVAPRHGPHETACGPPPRTDTLTVHAAWVHWVSV